MGLEVIERSELLKPLRGSFRSNAGNTGNVVNGVAHECLEVDDLVRPHAPVGENAGRVE